MKQLAIMLKPASSLCNMRCKYCFYSDVSSLRQVTSFGLMSAETRRSILENTFSQLESGDSLTIAFQGGEPTLAGLDWFRQMAEEVTRLSKPGIRISYAFQTNGLLLDEEWMAFFQEHGFLVGLSLDASRDFHDANRLDAQRKGTFRRILAVKEQMEHAQIPYNILTVLTNTMARHPGKIWKFLTEENISYVQFIPCLAALDSDADPYALTPRRYADFYIQLFELWYQDVCQGRFRSIKLFDDLLNLIARGTETACGLTGKCRGQLIVEADGSVYPCDFYALDEWRMGNLAHENLRTVYESPKMLAFCSRPKSIPAQCKACPYSVICGGGCHRMQKEVFCSPKDGFCGHRAFLDAALPRLQQLAQLV